MTALLNKFSEATDCYEWIIKPCFRHWKQGFAFGYPYELYHFLTAKNGRWNQAHDSLANRLVFLNLKFCMIGVTMLCGEMHA